MNMIITNWKWHTKTGYLEFQRQPAVVELLTEAAHDITDAAGGADAGFEVDVQLESGRRSVPRVSVRTATREAREAEARDRVLTKALDAGRG